MHIAPGTEDSLASDPLVLLARGGRAERHINVEVAQMAFTADSTLKQVLADPKAKAVLEKHIPGFSTHPLISMAMGMSLKTIAGFPQAGLSADKMKAILDDLAKL